ncbi:MAG: DUF2480 family protein [Saprospirales bacterium]|nr:MAG: DUF2480 family protein [Saprospirales bacterium]
MNTEKTLVNKVAASGLITIDLENFYPKEEWVELDIAEFLFKGLIVKEADFREKVSQKDWSQYAGKHLRIFCSADAIIPPWAYMLISKHAHEQVYSIGFGSKEKLIEKLMLKNMEQHLMDNDYRDKRILIKGCSTVKTPEEVYFAITAALLPICKSLMYGEACSNVPIYKQPIRRKVKN